MAKPIPLEEAVARFGTFAPAPCVCGHTLASHAPPVYECYAARYVTGRALHPLASIPCNCAQFVPSP
jgi:hypothetical protein